LHFPSKDPKSLEYHLIPIPDFPNIDAIFKERIQEIHDLTR